MEQNVSTPLWSQHNIPIELWPEILSRLPVKSLLRFRSVSHPWRLLIDDPAFARSHLTTFNNNNNRLLLLQRTHQETIAITASIVPLNNSDTLADDPRDLLPHLDHLQNCNVVGSADGLYMVLDGFYENDYGELDSEPVDDWRPKLILWNPSIRKVRILPPPPNLGQRGICFNLGIGFDPSIDDYKFVRLWMEDEYNTLASIAIYTFGTNSWKETPFNGDWRFNGISIRLHYSPRIVCFRGALYFISKTLTSGSFEVISFHFSREDFTYAGLPVDQDVYNHLDVVPDLTLVDGGSSVAVFFIQDDKGSIWVWDGIGAAPMAWSKRYTFALCDTSIWGYNDDVRIDLVYLKSERQMIIQWGGCGWIWSWMLLCYDLEIYKEKVVLSNESNSGPILKLYDHIENLMLLN